MRKHVLNTAAHSVLAVLAVAGPAWSIEMASDVSAESIGGAGRNIMRTADGGIVAAFSTITDGGAALIFGRSLDNGVSWNNVPVGDVNGAVVQTAIDSNFQGSYIAFTENVDGRIVGRIAFSPAPFGADPELAVSMPVTPEGVVPQDTFLQASRAGWGNLAADNRETVVYGWLDSISKGLYIGVSPDGRTFPVAQLVIQDEFAASGPAVAIRGNYVIATYQTTNPSMAPADVPAQMRRGRTYPAWVESLDGGQTWSEPRPLFGLTSAAFPTASVETAGGTLVEHRLAGGSSSRTRRYSTGPRRAALTAFLSRLTKRCRTNGCRTNGCRTNGCRTNGCRTTSCRATSCRGAGSSVTRVRNWGSTRLSVARPSSKPR